ncbi:hypothetical protein [Nocardioides sp. LML1-1-1.1]|uniref:hypothetical protein n=1 Tax=Nocardioides sp. LML1-1-1.1 TaxID=3135248 RepID=UPI00343677E9
MSAAPKWHQAPMVGLDTETTGTDPRTERVVTAAIVHTAPASRPITMQWLIHPGTEIPDEAAAVHGWTLDRLEQRLRGFGALRIAHGVETPFSREVALQQIAGQVAATMRRECALVVCNASYDLTLLEAELGRADLPTVTEQTGGITGVVDPMVLEKAWDPYRKVKGGCRGGKHTCGGCGVEDKTLGSLCQHYGIFHAGAHDAAADTLAAMRLAVRITTLWPDVARLKLSTLFEKQVGWRRQQADGLRKYFDRHEIEHDGVDPGWPLHTDLTNAQAVLA